MDGFANRETLGLAWAPTPGTAEKADGKQLAALLRIKALWHLHCCAFGLGGAGASGIGRDF
jgi:hypothetical protein